MSVIFIFDFCILYKWQIQVSEDYLSALLFCFRCQHSIKTWNLFSESETSEICIKFFKTIILDKYSWNTPEQAIITPSGVSPLGEGSYTKCALGHTISSYSMEWNSTLLLLNILIPFKNNANQNYLPFPGDSSVSQRTLNQWKKKKKKSESDHYFMKYARPHAFLNEYLLKCNLNGTLFFALLINL